MSADTTIHLALIQMRMVSDLEVNMRHAVKLAEQAAEEGARLVCLPEMYRSLYVCQREDAAGFDWAEPIPGPSTERFADVARRTGSVLVVPVFERRAAGVYHNSAAVIDADGTLAGVYRKMHIPDDPGYYEKYYFTPGDLGFRVFETQAGRIGVGICWDQWFPETARLLTLGGADVMLYPTAIGWHPRENDAVGAVQRNAWMTVQRGHAVANGVYVAAVNRIGLEQLDPGTAGLHFWGSSFLVGPQGESLAEAPIDQETILHGTIDLKHMENIRRNWPFLRDRRIEAYGDLSKRHLVP